MPSNWKVWDFHKSKEQIFDHDYNLYLVYCYDQYAFKYIKDCFDEKFVVVFGSEITQDWIDQKLRTMDLFGGMENFLVHFAEDISKDVLAELCSYGSDTLGQRKILLNFTKENSIYKEQRDKDNLLMIKISPPAFWEEEELLNFICRDKDVYLGFDEKRHFIDSVPFEMGAYADLLDKLKVNNHEREITIEDIDQNISVSKLDQFRLAELFGNKKMVLFYKNFIKLIDEGQDFYGPLYFLGSHMQKVYNRNYGTSKKRLSKYDKQILAQQRIWNQDQAHRAIKYFSELLIMYKADKKSLLNRVRADYAKVLFV